MSILDKAVAAVTPMESDEARAEARSKAEAAAAPGDWLALALDHHRELEAAFEATEDASTPAERRTAQLDLAELLTGHATAEETVLYPALNIAGEKGHATMGYTEQAAVKVQMAELELIDPMSQEFVDKLRHIAGAVRHHMYQEEGTWFLELKEKLDPTMQDRLTQRYQEEFERYVDGGGSMPQMDASRAGSAAPGLDAGRMS